MSGAAAIDGEREAGPAGRCLRRTGDALYGDAGV